MIYRSLCIPRSTHLLLGHLLDKDDVIQLSSPSIVYLLHLRKPSDPHPRRIIISLHSQSVLATPYPIQEGVQS
jgi:hypothetical protein